jgi:hypothetical protein
MAVQRFFKRPASVEPDPSLISIDDIVASRFILWLIVPDTIGQQREAKK